MKIADFHRINDAPPEEPPLTQAEIGVELAKVKIFNNQLININVYIMNIIFTVIIVHFSFLLLFFLSHYDYNF